MASIIAGSSALLVIKLFQEKYEIDTELGRIAPGILVFQDFWAIIVIIMPPTSRAPQLVPTLMSCLGIVILSFLIFILAPD